MPDARATREALYRSGLRRFALDGWRTARVRDIVAEAGQANDSAINYHFGSRAGLLREILTRGIDRMERRRALELPGVDEGSPVEDLVGVVVRPLTDLLDDDEGRDLLRIIGELGPLARIGQALDADPVAGTVLETELELLVAAVAHEVGERTARLRVQRMIVMLTAVVAARAAGLDGDPGGPDPRGSDPTGSATAEFVDDLVAGLAAGLLAQPSARMRSTAPNGTPIQPGRLRDS